MLNIFISWSVGVVIKCVTFWRNSGRQRWWRQRSGEVVIGWKTWTHYGDMKYLRSAPDSDCTPLQVISKRLNFTHTTNAAYTRSLKWSIPARSHVCSTKSQTVGQFEAVGYRMTRHWWALDFELKFMSSGQISVGVLIVLAFRLLYWPHHPVTFWVQNMKIRSIVIISTDIILIIQELYLNRLLLHSSDSTILCFWPFSLYVMWQCRPTSYLQRYLTCRKIRRCV